MTKGPADFFAIAFSSIWGENNRTSKLPIGDTSMKFILAFGVLTFALTFCGFGDRLKNISSGSSNSSGNTGGKRSDTGGSGAETPTLTAQQQSIQDASTETKWDEQGISWKLPAGWPKMQVLKESFNYGAPANGFLI